jgi:hypothetical protein
MKDRNLLQSRPLSPPARRLFLEELEDRNMPGSALSLLAAFFAPPVKFCSSVRRALRATR